MRMHHFRAQNSPFAQMRIFSENLLISLAPFIHAYLRVSHGEGSVIRVPPLCSPILLILPHVMGCFSHWVSPVYIKVCSKLHPNELPHYLVTPLEKTNEPISSKDSRTDRRMDGLALF